MTDDWPFLNLQLAPDEMSVSLGAAARTGVKRLPDAEALGRFLTQVGVVFGVEAQALEALAAELAADTRPVLPRVVATGQAPEAGRPGELRRCFRSGLEVGRLDAGAGADAAMDYRDRGLIVNVEADQVLLEIELPVPPRPGRTVTGRVLAAPEAPSWTPPRPGVNVRASPDGRRYLAACAGHLEEDAEALHVRDRFVLAGNVDYNTGNLVAHGSVEVQGDVAAGFRVQAGGSIRVKGVVGAGAELTAGGDIEVSTKVATGREHGGLRAVGGISAHEVVNSELDCEGDVSIGGAMLNSRVRCRGHFRALGPEAAVRGCDIEAIRGIVVDTVGCEDGPPSTLAVGLTREVAARLKAIETEIVAATQLKEFVFQSFAAEWPEVKGKAAVEALAQAERARYETGKREARERQEVQDEKINLLRAEQRELEARLFEDKTAVIRVERTIHPVCNIFVWTCDHRVLSRPTGPGSYALDPSGRKIIIGRREGQESGAADPVAAKAKDLEQQVRALAEQILGKRITAKRLVLESGRLLAEGALPAPMLQLLFKAMQEQRFQTEDLAAHINWMLLEQVGAQPKLLARGLPLADLALKLDRSALRPLALKARLLGETGQAQGAEPLLRELDKRRNQLGTYEHRLETIYHYAATLVALACPQGRARPGAEAQLRQALQQLKEVLGGQPPPPLAQAARRQVERIRALLTARGPEP